MDCGLLNGLEKKQSEFWNTLYIHNVSKVSTFNFCDLRVYAKQYQT